MKSKKIGKKLVLRMIVGGFLLVAMIVITVLFGGIKMSEYKNPVVNIETNKGLIVVELFPKEAPVTVKNFLRYVEDGFYQGTVFHRVIPKFMIQGGGFTVDGIQKKTFDPIILESNNGLKNTRGTIAMARTSDPDSATSQFFINLVDNDFLDFGARDKGYAVFGKVIEGMDVVDSIASTPTGSSPMPDWPLEDIVIKKITLIE